MEPPARLLSMQITRRMWIVTVITGLGLGLVLWGVLQVTTGSPLQSVAVFGSMVLIEGMFIRWIRKEFRWEKKAVSIETERIMNLFSELQEIKGNQIVPISKKTKLVKCDLIPYFVRIPFFILYNSKDSEKLAPKFDDDDIRFILLHEEGHAHYGYSWMLLPLIVVSVSYSVIQWSLNPYFSILSLPENITGITLFNAMVISAIIYSFLAAFFGAMLWRLAVPFKMKSEYFSDNYAASILKQCYSVGNPSRNLENALSLMGESFNPSIRFKMVSYILIYIGILFPDAHPSDCERVARVKQEVDNA
jgi:hypothetical protein